MMRKCLAILGFSFLLFAALLPANAQTSPASNPSTVPAADPAATAAQVNLPEEELGRFSPEIRESLRAFCE